MIASSHHAMRFISVFLCVAFLGMAGKAAADRDNQIEDAEITHAVEYELLLDPAVTSHNVDVKTADGIVTLSGKVDNVLAQDRAIKIAQSIKGVMSVIDQIEVQPVERPDEEVRKDIEQALFSDPAADSYQVEVEASDGAVTLTGKVDSWYEKQLSTRIAKGVRGVRQVNSDIKFMLNDARPDEEIEQEIRRRLENDVWVAHETIDVSVKDNAVMLTGTVGSGEERVNAYTKSWVAGVESVDISGLTVEPWSDEEMRRESKYVHRSDAEIKRAVEDALLYDPRVLSFKPTVEVDDGVVTLTGVVDNLKAKRAAEKDAGNTVGVWRVKNLLKVRAGEKIGDTQIADDIRSALARDPIVEKQEVTVKVRDGVARLYGNVDYEMEKTHIEALAAGVKGVTDIRSHLEVAQTSMSDSDWEIEQDIQDALFWNANIDADNITVDVDGGVATLKGTVNSLREYELAEQITRRSSAWKVRNRMNVNYGPEELRPQHSEKK